MLSKFSIPQLQELARLAEAGKTPAELSEHFHVTRAAIYYQLRKLGIEINKRVRVPRTKCPFCPSPKMKKYGLTKSGSQRYQCLDCLRTFSDFNGNNHYTPEWKRVLIRGLRKQGFSIRQIVAIASISKNTVEKYAEGIVAICGCGRPTEHKGWCSFRYQQSARRQAFMKGWGRGGTMEERKDLPSFYQQGLCKFCKKPTVLSQYHKDCWLKKAEAKRIAQESLSDVRKLLKEIGEIIKHEQENRQNRRPTRSAVYDHQSTSG